MEGKGFEPTVEALFGKNGFFPDTAMRTIYFVSENMPLRVNELLQNMMPALKRDRVKTQVLARSHAENALKTFFFNNE